MHLELSGGRITFVDTVDWDRFRSFRWYLTSHGYAATKAGKRIIYLHRIIMQAEPEQMVDHINGDKLDNRKANLRFCTVVENNRNHRLSKHNKSGYNGVYFDKTRNKWVAQYSLGNKTHCIGRYKTCEEAVLARSLIDQKLGFTYHNAHNCSPSQNR